MDRIRIIWLAMMVSIVIYGVVIFTAVPRADTGGFDAAFADPVVLALHFIAVAMFGMSFVIPGLLLRGRASSDPHRATGPRLTTPPPVETASIIRWALTESIAIFGLIAAFLRHEPLLFLPLGALAMIGMIIAFPGSRDEI